MLDLFLNATSSLPSLRIYPLLYVQLHLRQGEVSPVTVARELLHCAESTAKTYIRVLQRLGLLYYPKRKDLCVLVEPSPAVLALLKRIQAREVWLDQFNWRDVNQVYDLTPDIGNAVYKSPGIYSMHSTICPMHSTLSMHSTTSMHSTMDTSITNTLPSSNTSIEVLPSGKDAQLELVDSPTAVDIWFGYWQQKLKRAESKLTLNRRKLLQRAWQAGITIEQGKAAIDYVASKPFFHGENDRGGDYTDIITIFKTPERVEQYARQGGIEPQLKHGKPRSGFDF